MDWGNSHQRRTILVTRVTFHGLFKADVSKFCSEPLRYQSPSSLPPKSAWKGLTWAMWGRIAGLAVLISWSRDLPPADSKSFPPLNLPTSATYLPPPAVLLSERKYKSSKCKNTKYKIQSTGMDCLKLSPVTSCCVTVRNENEIEVQKNTDRRNLELIESLESLCCVHTAQSTASPYILLPTFIP